MAMNGNKGIGIGQSLGAEEKKEIKDVFDTVSRISKKHFCF